MKRFGAFLIFLSLVFCVSCAAAEIPEISPEYDASVGTDLTGYDCVIVQSSSTSGLINHIEDGNPFGYVATTTFADAVLQRFNDLEEKFGCKITLKTNTDGRENALVALMAGAYYGETLFSSDIQVMYNFGGTGVFLPIAAFSAINVKDTDKWGGFGNAEMNSYKGEIYGVTPMTWPLRQPHAVNVIVTNLTIANRYGLFDPREDVENGNWTWDGLERLIRDYYIVDGEITYSSLGCRYFDFVKLVVFGNGVNILYTDDSGKQVSDIYSQNAMDAFMWAKNIWMNYSGNLTYADASPEWASIAADFTDGKCVSVLSPTWMVYDTFAQEVEQFSVVPFPVGPEGTQGQWPSVLEGTEFFAFPFTSKDPDAAAFVVDQLCEPLVGFENESAVAEYLARNVLFDERDTDILMNLYKTGRYSYWPEGADGFWRQFGYAMKDKAPSEYFDANVYILEEIMEEYMKPNQAILEYLE